MREILNLVVHVCSAVRFLGMVSDLGTTMTLMTLSLSWGACSLPRLLAVLTCLGFMCYVPSPRAYGTAWLLNSRSQWSFYFFGLPPSKICFCLSSLYLLYILSFFLFFFQTKHLGIYKNRSVKTAKLINSLSTSWLLVYSDYYKICRLDGLNNRHLFFYSSGGWEVLDLGAGWFSFLVRALFLVCRWPPSHCVLTWQRERKSSDISYY